jgi:hypothetical protein
MIFTEPCCQVLKICLAEGEDRTFHRLGGGNGPLHVRVYTTRAGQDLQFHEQAVIFCPFCGTRLQTSEAVERFLKGDA